jgi:hypothetical protein
MNYGKKALYLVTVAMCLWAAIVVGAGLYRFWTDGAEAGGYGAYDLHMRWAETQYALHGINPFLVLEDHSLELPEIGRLRTGLCPWSMGEGAILVGPFSWSVTRFWHMGVQAISLIILFVFCFRTVQRSAGGWLAGLLAAGLFFGMFPVYTCLHVGQYSLTVLACLAGMYWCAEKHTRWHSVAAGLLFGMALVKPHMAALFGLYLLILYRDWIACLVAACWVLSLTLLVSWRVSTPPWELISSMTALAASYTHDGYNMGLLDPLKLWVAPELILLLDNVIGIVAVAFLLVYYRRLSKITLLAIPAVFTVLWAYNNKFDWAVLGLPIIAAARLYFVGQGVGLNVSLIRYGLIGMMVIVIGAMAQESPVNQKVAVAVQFASRLFFLGALLWGLRWEKMFLPPIDLSHHIRSPAAQ